MRKHIITGVRGVLAVKLKIFSEVQRNQIESGTYTGHAQIKLNESQSKKQLFDIAIKDALFQHFHAIGLKLGNYVGYEVLQNNYSYIILDYHTKSLGEGQMIKVKREIIKPKSKRIKKGNKYYMQISDQDNNEIETKEYKRGSVGEFNKKAKSGYYSVVRDKKTNEVIHTEKFKTETKLQNYEKSELLPTY